MCHVLRANFHTHSGLARIQDVFTRPFLVLKCWCGPLLRSQSELRSGPPSDLPSSELRSGPPLEAAPLIAVPAAYTVDATRCKTDVYRPLSLQVPRPFTGAYFGESDDSEGSINQMLTAIETDNKTRETADHQQPPLAQTPRVGSASGGAMIYMPVPGMSGSPRIVLPPTGGKIFEPPQKYDCLLVCLLAFHLADTGTLELPPPIKFSSARSLHLPRPPRKMRPDPPSSEAQWTPRPPKVRSTGRGENGGNIPPLSWGSHLHAVLGISTKSGSSVGVGRRVGEERR